MSLTTGLKLGDITRKEQMRHGESILNIRNVIILKRRIRHHDRLHKVVTRNAANLNSRLYERARAKMMINAYVLIGQLDGAIREGEYRAMPFQK